MSLEGFASHYKESWGQEGGRAAMPLPSAARGHQAAGSRCPSFAGNPLTAYSAKGNLLSTSFVPKVFRALTVNFPIILLKKKTPNNTCNVTVGAGFTQTPNLFRLFKLKCKYLILPSPFLPSGLPLHLNPTPPTPPKLTASLTLTAAISLSLDT